MKLDLDYMYTRQSQPKPRQTLFSAVLLCSAVSLPLAYVLYLVNTTLSGGFIAPERWLVAACFPLLMASYGLMKNSLAPSGAVAGIALSQVLILANYGFLCQLLVFFITGSRVTRYKQHIKAKFDENFREGGGRDWVQVLSTGGPAAVLGVAYLTYCGSGERYMDLQNEFNSTVITTAVLGCLGCANGDTFSSEIGAVSGPGRPVLITTFQHVPTGTNGGVSLVGTLASVAGGCLVGIGHLLCNTWCLPPPSPGAVLLPLFSMVVLGGVAGGMGSLIDSLLGATLQYSGINSVGVIVSSPGLDVRRITGRPILSNEGVNVISEIITATLLPLLLLAVY